MIKEMIKKAADGIDLTYDEAAEVTREIMTGSTTPGSRPRHTSRRCTSRAKLRTKFPPAPLLCAMSQLR